MSTVTSQYRIPRPVARKVSRLRLMVRLYVLLESLAAIVLVAGAAFWLGLAIDWTFEPSPAVHIAMWIIFVAVALWMVWKYLLNRFSRRLPAESLALLIERQHPDFADSLVTTVQAKNQRPVDDLEKRFLEQTGIRASETVKRASLGSVFRLKPLVSKGVVATMLVASIAAFALISRETFDFWLQRMQLSTAPWPRKVMLSSPEFAEENTHNVARNDAFEFQVHASIEAPHESPSYVEIRYRGPDGRIQRDRMVQVGRALPGRDKVQVFRYEFPEVAGDMQFDVIGGDARLEDLRLRAVARPAVDKLSLECTFPEYLNRAAQSYRVSSRQEIPVGTHLLGKVTATKPLRSVRVFDATEQMEIPALINPSAPREFQFNLATLSEDRQIKLTLTDTDGVENREPYRLDISAILDELPEVSVQLQGVTTAVTPQAKIPLAGVISDDYGLKQVWSEAVLDEQPPQQRSVADAREGSRKVTRLQPLDLAVSDPQTGDRLLLAKPGQKLTVTVLAEDAYNLDDQSRTASCPRFRLDVVTPSELRGLLERRELGLRQRFESIYEKMVGTRDLLERVEEDLTARSTSQAEAENDSSDERTRERSRLRILGARQNTTQLAYESLGVAEGFEGIVTELVNNRIDTEDLKDRLEQGISQPLEEIANRLMPELEVALGNLRSSYETDPANVRPQLATAQTHAQEVVEAMKAVLDRMLELESYNELVDLLRAIVKEQEQLRQETQEQRKNKLRRLLED